jgi:DNA-binding winged helix-turn-helix (wHTH) protein/Tfp pilus assembly protein PilF
MNHESYKFGDFRLDPAQRKLFKRDKIIRLSPRAFEILLLLVQKQGEIIEKNELLDKVWTDSFVEESNLVVHISALRRSLGERRGERKFIETVSGRGYSFVFPVEKSENEKAVSVSKNEIAESEIEISKDSTSLAILPFVNKSENDDLEYLANGLTQSLIDNLSQIPNLRVMSHSAVEHYKNAKIDLQEIGFLLGVEKILLGSIGQFKNRLEIRTELINAEDKSHLWGMNYECELIDIFEVRKEISLAIAGKIQTRFSKTVKTDFAHDQTTNFEAYRLYLKGIYLLDGNATSKFLRECLHSALKFFHQALKKDPEYALAYTGVGVANYRLFNVNFLKQEKAYAECKKAVQMALSLDPTLSEALTLNGIIQFFFERNIAEAERSFDRAIASNPNNPIAHHYKSVLLCCFEKCDEAIFYQTEAIRLDPTSLFLNNGLTTRFYFTREYNKAIIQAEETLELDKELVSPFFISALSYAQIGMFGEALKQIKKAIALQDIEEMFFAEAYIYAAAGEHEKAKEIANEILSRQTSIDYTDAATVFAALRENDRAFEYLEKAGEKGGGNILLIRSDPRFSNLHADGRFDAFLKKLNLKN